VISYALAFSAAIVNAVGDVLNGITFVRDAKRTYDGPVFAMRDGDVISLLRDGGMQRSHHLRF
jgi:hypothetical protein